MFTLGFRFGFGLYKPWVKRRPLEGSSMGWVRLGVKQTHGFRFGFGFRLWYRVMHIRSSFG